MKMLVLILNDEKMVDHLLIKLREIGVKGATVLDSVGMGGILGIKIPFLPKERLVQIEKPDNKTIFTVIEEESVLRKAIDLIKTSLHLEKPGTGFMFVLPVLEAYGAIEIKSG